MAAYEETKSFAFVVKYRHHYFVQQEVTENTKLRVMGSAYDLNSNCQGVVELVKEKVHVNGLQHSDAKGDSFVVDMGRFSQLIEKDTSATSRITLQRNLSRKGSGTRGAEKQFNSTTVANEREANMLTTSPKVSTLHQGNSMPEKPTIVALGATDHSAVPQLHHHITITNNSTAAESKLSAKRLSFRRSPHSWSIDPRRILLFFATLSSVGTILLIIFTLSVTKFNGNI